MKNLIEKLLKEKRKFKILIFGACFDFNYKVYSNFNLGELYFSFDHGETKTYFVPYDQIVCVELLK